ncbi:MAG: type II toxin-antitoxin system PemK/MazF family toxin [Bryobacterales bacterium]|nr:type II toxin-antitoxin system PemK/MazF family toxin [Bryobacterales bacterium]
MIARGQIHFVNLDPIQGREQSGYRPVLVVSADSINRQPLVISVIVGTDAAHLTRDYPTNVRVTAAESGLPKDTVFLAFQLRSLDPGRLVAPHAAVVPPARMEEVEQALRLVLSL